MSPISSPQTPPAAIPLVAPARSTGRWAEAGLLVVALLLGLSGFLLTALNRTGSSPGQFLPLAGCLVAAAVFVHLWVRRTAPWADPVILPTAVALNGLGLAMIQRLDMSYKILERTHNYAIKQAMWTGVGIVLFCAMLLVRDYRLLRRWDRWAMWGGLAFLVLPFVPGLGQSINGARIWIRLGPMSFQPAEMTKVLLAVFFASFLVANRDNLALAGRRIMGINLPRCGGASTDIVDALTWASGGHVNGVPDNEHPAQVINMSLGGEGVCPVFYQRAIDAAVERGSIIVAAAGNEDADVSGVAPAGCQNVITVGATGATGARSFYSNYGADVDVSAPGGDPNVDNGIVSAVDESETTPEGPAYAAMVGTSQAAPHVSGTIALLRAIDPALTTEDAVALLQSTATPLTVCDRDACGTGIINATAAVDELIRQRTDDPGPSPSPGTDEKGYKNLAPLCRSGDSSCRS